MTVVLIKTPTDGPLPATDHIFSSTGRVDDHWVAWH